MLTPENGWNIDTGKGLTKEYNGNTYHAYVNPDGHTVINDKSNNLIYTYDESGNLVSCQNSWGNKEITKENDIYTIGNKQYAINNQGLLEKFDSRSRLESVNAGKNSVDLSNYEYQGDGVFTYTDSETNSTYTIEVDKKGNTRVYNPANESQWVEYDKDGNPTKGKVDGFERNIKIDPETGKMYTVNLGVKVYPVIIDEHGVLSIDWEEVNNK